MKNPNPFSLLFKKFFMEKNILYLFSKKNVVNRSLTKKSDP